MKLIVLTILILTVSCSKKEKSTSMKQDFNVQKDIKVNLNNKNRGIIGSYWIESYSCLIKWSYSISSSKNEKNITLEVSDNSIENKDCDQSIETLLSMHSSIIEKFKSEYSIEKVRTIKVRGLRAIDPLKRCNKQIAVESSKYDLYQDYREKYPRHKSKLSLNEIFKKLMTDKNICGSFIKVLQDNKLPSSLYSAEKIFTNKKEILEKYFDATSALSSRVIWDAAYFYIK
jgi:hypothetical protein